MSRVARIPATAIAEGALTDGHVPTVRDGGLVMEAPPGAGSGAPTTCTYLVVSAEAALSNERTLAAGAGISLTDNGPGSTLEIAATGGGGGTAAQVTLDFSTGKEQASVALADATVVATTRATAAMAVAASADKTADEVLADPIWVACQVVAGVGLTVYGKPLNGGQLFGKYLVDVIYK